MATRPQRNPELAAAAKNLSSAAHHIRRAINKKLDEIGTTVSAELGKAKRAAMTKGGQAKRRFDALLKTAETRLKKVNADARKSMHQAVGEAEKKLLAAKKVVAKRVAAKKAVKKRVVAKKATAKRAPAKKTAPRRAAARRPAA